MSNNGPKLGLRPYGWPNVFSPEDTGMAIEDVWPPLYIGVERVDEMKRKVAECEWAASALDTWRAEAEIVLDEEPAFVRQPSGGRSNMFTSDSGHHLLFDPTQCDRMFDPALRRYVTPDAKARQAWVTLQHERMRRLMTSLAFMYRVTGDERYSEWVWRGLRDLTALYVDHARPAAGEKKVHSLVYGGLYEAQSLLAAIQAYTLVASAPQASDEDRHALRTHVFDRSGEMLSSWMSVMMVHNMSCWGMAAIAVLGKHLDRPDWVDKALTYPQSGLQTLLRDGLPRGANTGKPDGFWHETSPFYGCFYALVSLVPLYRIGEEEGVLDEDLRERFRSLFEAPLALCDSELNLVSVGDRVSPGALTLTQMRYVYEYAAGEVDPERYGPILAMLYERSGAPRDSLAAVAWGPDALPPPAGVPSRSVVLDATRMATFRGRTDDGPVTLFFLGGGDTAAAQGHHHCDKLSVSLHACGDIVTSDLGEPLSTGTNEWSRLLFSSLAHNTLLVNELDQGTMEPVAFEADVAARPAWAHAAVRGDREGPRQGLWRVMKQQLKGRLEEGVCDDVALSRTVFFDPPFIVLADDCEAPGARRFGFSFSAYGNMTVTTDAPAGAVPLHLPSVPEDGIYSLFTGRTGADPVTQIVVDWRVRSHLWLRMIAVSDGPLDATWGETPGNPREQARGTVLLRAPGTARRFATVLELHRGTPRTSGVVVGDNGSVVATLGDGTARAYQRPT